MGVMELWDYVNGVFRRLRGDASGRAVTLPEGQYLAVPGTLDDEEYHHLTLTVDKKLRVDDPTTQAAIAVVEGKVDDIEVKLDTPTNFMADLTTLESRLSAARAGYLDQLDFALQEAIAALQTDLDNPAQFKADLSTLESRLSAARAGYLDQLDFNLQEAIAAIPTTMRGTDNAALAAVWTAALAGVLANYTAVRAANLDELDFALQEAIAAIPTVMVGTDGAALASSWTAALAGALANYTAVRAGYLDQLDFALQEAIAAIPTTAMRGTDGAALASAWTAALAGVLANYTAVRAGYLDQLDFNLQEAIAAIPTTAMRGTDNALLAANYTAERGTNSAQPSSTALTQYNAIIAAIAAAPAGAKFAELETVKLLFFKRAETLGTDAGDAGYAIVHGQEAVGEPLYSRMTCPAGSGKDARTYGVHGIARAAGGPERTPTTLIIETRIKLEQTTATEGMWGTGRSITKPPLGPTSDMAQFVFDKNVSNYFNCVSYGTAVEVTATNILGDTSWHRYRIEIASANVKFYIDGVLKATHTQVPDAGLQYDMADAMIMVETEAAVAKSLRYEYFALWLE